MLSGNRLPIVGVMGSGTEPHSERTVPLGEWLARRGVHLLTGGGGGVMASVSEAFWSIRDRRGSVIGVIPGDERGQVAKAGYPNPWVEIAIRTHLSALGERGAAPDSRNHINVLSSNVLVVLPGGAGTASEVALSGRYGRPVVAFGSRPEFPSLPPSATSSPDLAEVCALLERALSRVP